MFPERSSSGISLASPLPTRRLTKWCMLAACSSLQMAHPIFAEAEVPWLIEAAQEEVAAQVHLQKKRSDAHLAAVLLVHQDDIPTCKGCGGAQLLVRTLAQLKGLLRIVQPGPQDPVSAVARVLQEVDTHSAFAVL